MKPTKPEEVTPNEFFAIFFRVKNLENRNYKLYISGVPFEMDTQTVIDMIVNHTTPDFQNKIVNNLIKIEFRDIDDETIKNDIHDYLQWLAAGYGRFIIW